MTTFEKAAEEEVVKTFEVVPEEEREAAIATTRLGRPVSQIARAVMEGQLVFVPDANTTDLRNPRSAPRKAGFRVYHHVGTRGGVRGVFVWAEKVEP